MLMRDHFDEIKMKVNDISQLELVEEYLASECSKRGIELSHDTMAEEPLKFWSLGYGYIAGCMVVYPQSTQAYNAFLIDAIRRKGPERDNSKLFESPKDKYKNSEVCTFDNIEKLVVLPGSNILRSLVDRNQLIRLAKDGAYAKVHPVTNPEDKKEIKNLFGDRTIDSECGLYEAFSVAKSIYTTSASESALFAVMNDKDLFSIEEDRHDFKGAYSPLINMLFWNDSKKDRKDSINALINSDITNIFHPDGEYKAKINNFLDIVGEKCQQI
jgi:hypothetical protein